MKLWAPAYYKSFACIADKCDHSCCVGWEIDIDSETYGRYKALEGGYAQQITESISVEGGTPHFRLGSGDRCPHLDGRGLCRIIFSFGEEHLCHICREHPRFYNYTDRVEVGLGMSCREAARLILSSPDYDAFEEIGELDIPDSAPDTEGRGERQRIYGILKDGGRDYGARLDAIYKAYGIETGEDGRWLELLGSLEYLDGAHRDMFLRYSAALRPTAMDEYLERALAYFLYRHLTEAEDREECRTRISFCLFLERLLASLLCTEGADTLESVAVPASILSEEIEYSEDNTDTLMYT
ncbi:MAG: flagellin lysine-N-methylase [Clostridia bacterium]|nr:flagellin lysine-N-methylase [Clostridia bacterium]